MVTELSQELFGITVLVVDDDSHSRKILRRVLEHHGASVTLADGFDAAVAFLEVQRVDVIVSDIAMPGRDGYDLVRTLREDLEADEAEERTPVIAVTSNASAADVEMAHAAGFQHHLAKPVDLKRLVRAVRGLAALGGEAVTITSRALSARSPRDVPEGPRAP